MFKFKQSFTSQEELINVYNICPTTTKVFVA